MTEPQYTLLEVIKEWLPLALSVFALAVTATFSWMTHADRREAALLSREKDLHHWSREIADIYVEMQAVEEAIRSKASIRMCVMIDYGRLLFPNERSTRALKEYHKGRRSSVLDPLVETCNRALENNWDARKLAQDWREFTDQLNSRTTAFAVDTSPEAEGKKQYRNQ